MVSMDGGRHRILIRRGVFYFACTAEVLGRVKTMISEYVSFEDLKKRFKSIFISRLKPNLSNRPHDQLFDAYIPSTTGVVVF